MQEHPPHHGALVQIDLAEDQVIDCSVGLEGIEILQGLVSNCVGTHDQFVFGSRTMPPNRFDRQSREMNVITVGENADGDLRHDVARFAVFVKAGRDHL